MYLKMFSIIPIFLLLSFGFDEGVNDQEKNSEEKITDTEARKKYAELLRNLKKYEESLSQYKKLLEENKDNKLIKIEIAKIYYYQGKYKEALQLAESIQLKEHDDLSLALMSDLYIALKEYDKAEKVLKNQIEKYPNDSFLKLKLAEILSWQKRYAESTKLYEKLILDNPTDIQLRRKYAFVLMWNGDEEKAAHELKKTLK